MTRIAPLPGVAPIPIPLLVAGALAAALALVLTSRAIRRDRKAKKRFDALEVKVAALAALGCTAYSANTSWHFAADYLDMSGTAERAGMFAAGELALFATALMARQNLAAQGAPGVPGTLVWVITGVQVIPAYSESGPVGGTVRAVIGPVMAAVLWHLAMGIELRRGIPGATSRSLLATLGREARERILSRLGIAARDRDSAQITRDRATSRAVTLAARLAERTPERQQTRRGRRLTRRLSKALGRAAVGTDSAQRGELLAQLATRRHALTLATVPLPSPWSPTQHGATSPATVPDQPRHLQHTGDRGPTAATQRSGPVPATEDHVPGTGDPAPGTGDRIRVRPTTDGSLLHEGRGNDTGTTRITAETPAHGRSNRGPEGTAPGTNMIEDRGPSSTDTGTDLTGDWGRRAPLRRKPTPKTKSNSQRANRSRSPQTQHDSREPEQSVEQLVEQVRPHIASLLERDGNETVTRVQLREILRREGLKGGRNDRLSLVLAALRSNDATTTERTVR